MTRTTGVVSKWRSPRRVARIGTAAMLAISVLACGGDDGDGGNALQTEDTLGLENGWVANAVVGSAGAPGGIFLLGGHRLDPEGSGYETRADSFWMSAEGELNSIPAPPTVQGIGAGSGIALGDSLHVILQDCAVGGDPTSGGFACLSSDRLLRFYEFNLSDEVWTELELPAEIKAMERGYPTLVPGQVLEGGSVFFGVSTGQLQGVADLILGFDTSTDEWSTVSRGRPAVGNACSDGRDCCRFG